jgi:hypothetical protein
MATPENSPGPAPWSSGTPRYTVVQCPRCITTNGLEPPPNNESARECRLCTGSMLLLVDGHEGDVRAVVLPR